jgi:hypothetical protein
MWLEILGWIGSILLVTSYFLLSTNKLSQNSKIYHLLNLLGSTIFIIFSFYKIAYASAFVNIIFSLIALYSLIKLYKNGHQKSK